MIKLLLGYLNDKIDQLESGDFNKSAEVAIFNYCIALKDIKKFVLRNRHKEQCEWSFSHRNVKLESVYNTQCNVIKAKIPYNLKCPSCGKRIVEVRK